jgi:hypothetical protein
VKGAWNFPELLGAAGGGVNHFRMAARKRHIFFITNQENRKGARRDGFHRRNFRNRKAAEFFSTIEQRPSERGEERLAEPGILAKSGIVVGGFAEIGEGGFGDDRFDARIGSGGLQRDTPAHGFAQGENVPRRRAGQVHRTALRYRAEEVVDDRARVVALEPAVGGDGALAGAVGAGVHHDHTVARAEQEFRLAYDAHAVVGHAVKEQHPRTVGIQGSDLPAAEKDTVRGTDVEILTLRVGDGKRSVGFPDEIRREFEADGMKEPRRDQPAPDRRQERREEQQDQGDADQSFTHTCANPSAADRGSLPEDTSRTVTGFSLARRGISEAMVLPRKGRDWHLCRKLGSIL